MDTPFLPARYRLIRTLGEGGVGRVLLCEDTQRGIQVAIKLLAPVERANDTEDDWARRLIEEARILAKLDHPNIVGVLDAGKLDSGRPYLVFDYVEGTDLAHVLEKSGPLGHADAFAYIGPVISALGHAHAQGIIHRDVKPANVLVRAADGQPVLADFGCARSADRSIKTQAGIVLGTPGFVAPEVLTGDEPIPASDLYGVGCILFEALVGKPPFAADSAATLLLAHLREPVPSSGLSRPLDRFIQRALAKKPADRFADAAEMTAALEQTRAELDRGTPARSTHNRTAVVSRETAVSAATTRPISRGDVTVVGKSERLARHERRVTRQAQVTRVILAVLLVGASLGLGLMLRARSERAAPVRPAITLDARGNLKAVWQSIRDTRCCLVARPATGAPLERCEDEPARAHAVVLEGLESRGAYAVSVRTEQGDVVFTRQIELPDVQDVRVVAVGAERSRVTVKLRGQVSGLELLRAGDKPLPPTSRTETSADFDLPMARTLVPGGWEVRVLDVQGVRSLIPVTSGADAVKRVLSVLKPGQLESAYRDLTAAPDFYSEHAHPIVPGNADFLKRPIADRAREARRANRQAPGGYATRVRTRLESMPGVRELLELSEGLPAFFESARVEPAIKRDLYELLRVLEWADRLCLAQFDPPALNVGRWYAPYMKFGFELRDTDSDFKPSSPIIKKTRAFVDPDVKDPAPFEPLRKSHPGWASFALSSRADTPAVVAQAALPVSALATMYPQYAESAGLYKKKGRVQVRARVAMLDPTHTLEVTFRGDNPSDFVAFDLGQPAKDAWRQEMDGLLPDGQVAANRGGEKESVRFGEISAQFDAALLPKDRLNLEIRYAHVPGVDPSRLTGPPRFATLASMRMRVIE